MGDYSRRWVVFLVQVVVFPWIIAAQDNTKNERYRRETGKKSNFHDSLKEECLKLWNNSPKTEEGATNLPPACLQFVQVSSLSSAGLLSILANTGGDVQTATHLLNSPALSAASLLEVVDHIKNNTAGFSSEVLSAIVASELKHSGDPHHVTEGELQSLGPLAIYLSADSLNHMDHQAFDYILDYSANLSHAIAGEGNSSHTVDNHFDSIYESYENSTRFLQELCKKAFRFPEHFNTVGRQNLRRLAWLFPCAPPKICKQADTETVKNNLDLFQFLPWSCGDANIYTNVEWLKSDNIRNFLKRGASCGRALVQKADLNKTDWNSYKALGLMMKCARMRDLRVVFKAINCTEVETTVKSYINMGVIPDPIVRIVSRRCLKPNVTNFNCSTVISYGAGLSKGFFKNIPTADLCTDACFEGLMKATLLKRVKRFLSSRCSSLITFDSNHVGEMGSGIVGLPMDVIKNINASDILSIIEDVKNHEKSSSGKKDARERAVLRQIAKKLNTSGKITSIMDSEDIVQELSIKDLKSSITDVVSDLGLGNTTVEPHFSDFQNKFLMKKVMETESPENMTEPGIRKLKTLVTGLVSFQIADLNPYQRTSIAVALCGKTHWPLKSAKSIFQSLILQPLKYINSSHPLSAMSAVEASNIGCECLMYLDPAYLASASVDLCNTICGAIGACHRFRCLNPPHRRRMMDACLSCMGVAQGAKISTDAMSVLGNNLLQQLNGTEFSTRINSTDLVTLLPYFSQGCMNKTQRNALRDRILAVHGLPSTWDADFLEAVKGIFYILGESNINTINQTLAADVMDDIVNTIVPMSDESKENDKCCRRWLTDVDRADMDSLKMDVFDLAKNIKLESASTETIAKRKKRSTVSLTCVDIMDMGNGVLTLTDAQLQAVSAEEFADCLSTLGLIEGWSANQRSLLYLKAKIDIGNVCNNMTSGDVASLGNVAVAMSVADIQCLNLDSDLVGALGQLYTWSDEQLSALSSRYTSVMGRSPNAFTAGDISTLGSIICGFSDNDLYTIPPAQFSESGAQLGQLQVCDTYKLQALATVAVHIDAYGPTSNWDASTLSEVGILTAGLSSSSLQAIPTTSIEGITVQAIPLIGSQVSAFSEDQLQEFSEAQANAVTDAQLSELTTSQQNILQTAIYGAYASLIQDPTPPPTNPGNAAGRTFHFLEWLVLLVSLLQVHALLQY